MTNGQTGTQRLCSSRVLRPETSCRRAADGVFIAWTDGDDFTGGVVELAIDESEPLCPLTWYVELDVREPSQVSTDVSVAEFLAGY